MDMMVGVPLNEELAEFIGKKGDTNSMVFYHRKLNDDTIVALAPSSTAEKFYALPEILLVSDVIVLSTSDIDSYFGEALIGASLAGKKVIFTDDNDVSAITSKLNLKEKETASKETLLSRIIASKPTVSGEAKVCIDRAFNVKGVGDVLLGIVLNGTVTKHSDLVHSSGKSVTIRSIQCHDVDVDSAGQGARVGLAVKGMDADQIKKGDILAKVAVPYKKEALIEVHGSGISEEKMEVGKHFYMASNLSYTSMSISSVEGNGVRIRLDGQMPLAAGDRVLLIRDAPQPRIFAYGIIK